MRRDLGRTGSLGPHGSRAGSRLFREARRETKGAETNVVVQKCRSCVESIDILGVEPTKQCWIGGGEREELRVGTGCLA